MSNAYLEYLNTLSKEELVEMIYKPKKQSIPFPHKSYRNISIKLSFEGLNYRGIQQHKFIKSIGNELCASLEITGIGHSPVYCGRTDAGVSAVAMIVNMQAKSRFENPNRSYKLHPQDYDEYPYDKIINERLPCDIRVIGWAPVPDDFSARYSCVQRIYRYYFVKNNLDIEKMREAADRIMEMDNFYVLSTHSNPKANYDRKIDSIEFIKVRSNDYNQKNAFKSDIGLKEDEYSSSNTTEIQSHIKKIEETSLDEVPIEIEPVVLENKSKAFLCKSTTANPDKDKNIKNGKKPIIKQIDENLLNKNLKYPVESNEIDHKDNLYSKNIALIESNISKEESKLLKEKMTDECKIKVNECELERKNKLEMTDECKNRMHKREYEREKGLDIHSKAPDVELKVDNSDDLYYMEIKAHSFLHNMVRKIFWVLKNCGEGNGFVLKNVEIAEPANLVFVSAKYPVDLEFITNRFNREYFLRRENELKVLHAISKLKLDKLSDE